MLETDYIAIATLRSLSAVKRGGAYGRKCPSPPFEGTDVSKFDTATIFANPHASIAIATIDDDHLKAISVNDALED